MTSLRILSTGKALPSMLVTADQLDMRLGQPDGYSFKKSGVSSRHFASAADSQSDLGARALNFAINSAGIRKESIDLLISACGVQEQALPSTACHIAEAAKLPRGTPAFDVNASCLSFITALQVASSLLTTHTYKRIAIVSADLASRGIDWDNWESSLIFGDGAAAVIVEKGTSDQKIRAYGMETYTEGRTFCEIRAGGTKRNPRTGYDPKDFLFSMDGKAVFKLASKVMPAFVDKLLADAYCEMDDISLVVPHQASHLGMAHLSKTLGIPSKKVMNIYPTHGNQVAASIPTALHEAMLAGRAKPGDRIMLLGTAAGLTIGGAILEL